VRPGSNASESARKAPPLIAPMKKIGPNSPPGAPLASDRMLLAILATARTAMSVHGSSPFSAALIVG
jgi:hypothetical protein